ncbi:OmpA family protein [Vitiosangium sp. GDMCC 1.1324]|uniref:OmpA family protein n=1 Tax=Vitiosangium sp. (strain GDMCC 1.1324) TaxID=2138576 RepID=UPI000D378CC8|nr:OmpA family protein [Vitiosangium sp. GDMCC 1.1324]PTL76150.1 cell envelope biogenesis protein OmpA [Vitiosangium sp. GDMCC 1.1324]
MSSPSPLRSLLLTALLGAGAARAEGSPASATPSAPPPSKVEALAPSSAQETPSYEAHSPATLGNSWTDGNNLRHASTSTGGVGLLRVTGADPGRKGVLRFSAMGEFFSSSDFPVQGANNTRTSGTFSIGYVPLDFLDVSLSYTASTNTNTRSSPTLIQALGDVTLGARVAKQWLPGLWAGADVRVMTFSGVGDKPIAFGFSPRAVATYDARTLSPRVPLRAHANLGLLLDGTGSLVDADRLNASEEYALGINRYTRLTLGLGVEAPLPVVTPFLEYGLTSPLGVQGGQLVAPDGTLVSVGSVAPQTLGLGVRVTALQNITFTAAGEFGLTRQVGRGVQPVPPFNLLLGASINVDPSLQATGGTRVVERVIREPVVVTQTATAPQTAQVSGVVLDAKTRQPIPGVFVAMVDSTLPPVASAPDNGRFLTYALPSGPVKLSVRKEGYLPLEKELVLKAGETASVELALVAEVKPAVLALAVTSKRKPVSATLAFLGGPEPRQVAYSEANAASHSLQLPNGRYTVEVTAPGFLAQTRSVQVTDGASLELAFDLEPEPKQWQVKRENDKLELLQPVRFTDGKATLLPDSHPLLSQVVDLVVRTGIKRIRIEGHTDNQGDKAANLALSKDRAQAVADYLIKAGLDPARIESEGFGDSRPVAPNLTPKGRELNRRVDFVILER